MNVNDVLVKVDKIAESCIGLIEDDFHACVKKILEKEPKDTFPYELKNRREIVYYGITKNLHQRDIAHANSNKVYTHMQPICGPISRSSAKKLEAETIRKYRSRHAGKQPKYNVKKR